MNEFFHEYIVLNGFNQNKGSDFKESKRIYSDCAAACYFSTAIFKRKFQNVEMDERAWLVYSENKGLVFCVPCMLFGNGVNHCSLLIVLFRTKDSVIGKNQ